MQRPDSIKEEGKAEGNVPKEAMLGKGATGNNEDFQLLCRVRWEASGIVRREGTRSTLPLTLSLWMLDKSTSKGLWTVELKSKFISSQKNFEIHVCVESSKSSCKMCTMKNYVQISTKFCSQIKLSLHSIFCELSQYPCIQNDSKREQRLPQGLWLGGSSN